MAGRTHQAQSVMVFPLHHGIHRGSAGAGRRQSDRVGFWADRRIAVKVAAALFRRAPGQPHHGGRVPEGSVVLLLTASANRDERRFPDADTFDVLRKIDHHVTFGYGIHFCLGAALARLEGRVFFEELLDAFPTIELTGEPVRLRSNLNNSYKRIPVRLATAG